MKIIFKCAEKIVKKFLYIDVGDLVYEALRNGSTLWEIGFPDRSAAEFYIPDANPRYINKLYLKQERLAPLVCLKRSAMGTDTFGFIS